MPCIVPNCNPNDQCFALRFPRSYLLTQRWKQAIEVGSGVPLADDVDFLTAEVCQQHFRKFDNYSEPVIFSKDASSSCCAETRLSSCGLCLTFVLDKEVVSNWEELTLKGIKIVELLQLVCKTGPQLSNDYFDGVCLQCLVRLDLVATISSEFSGNVDISSRIESFAEAEKQKWFKSTTAGEPMRNGKTQLPFKTITLEVELLDCENLNAEGETIVNEEIFDTSVSLENPNVSEQNISVNLGLSENDTLEESTVSSRNVTHLKKAIKPTTSRGHIPKRQAVQSVKKPRKPYCRKDPSKKQKEKIYLRKLNNQKCYICIKVFESVADLQAHLIDHDSELLVCNECNETCSSLITYNRHLAKHDSNERPFKCKHCYRRFSEKSGRRYHEASIHGDGEFRKMVRKKRAYTCQHCGKSFTTMPCLMEHENAHQGLQEYKCAICDRSFGCRANMERHHRTHTSLKPLLCKNCNGMFNLQSKYEEHLKMGCNTMCNNSSNNNCELCPSKFRKHDELVKHTMCDHSDEHLQFFKCKICKKRFLKEKLYRSHMERHKQMSSKNNQCHECGKKFATPLHLKSHGIKHTEVRSFMCSWCPQTFKRANNLRRHEDVHRGVKNHKCDTCDKKFALLSTLQNHKRVHTGERPFGCEQCGKRFSDPSTLYRHRKNICKE